MIECLDYILLEKKDIAEKNLEEGREYEVVLRYQTNFSCIGEETDLWVKNGGFAMNNLGKAKIIEVIHFPELINGEIYTKIKFKINKLEKGLSKKLTGERIQMN